ncbi:hypothetical protein CYMTET_56462 [Cymbomonas tetramitiformis]|uniref:Uncharacterized protein n=1 Tax=Cymbomonas tetramitiformis TaxID=36881 RepID=A0AAE0BCL9_9CHLO|nr:hypothetical protein CYMTET_56462 [Cymbomonas tetramitiformis]
MGVGAAAYTAANDIDSVQVSGRAAPQPVLCRGDLCIYPGISELDPVTLDAVLHSLGAATVVHRPPDPLESGLPLPVESSSLDVKSNRTFFSSKSWNFQALRLHLETTDFIKTLEFRNFVAFLDKFSCFDDKNSDLLQLSRIFASGLSNG